LEPRFESLNGT